MEGKKASYDPTMEYGVRSKHAASGGFATGNTLLRIANRRLGRWRLPIEGSPIMGEHVMSALLGNG